MNDSSEPRGLKRRGRDIHEAHRVSTPLELLFDLTFVVAISLAAAQLHHGLAEGHVLQVLPTFILVFFSIWWAWMNYSWFASAYDNDDTLFRLLTMLQMVGVLVLATGIDGVFNGQWTTMVFGYVLMRVALVVQWVRAGRGDPDSRATCFRYAKGIIAVQAFWVARLALPSEWLMPSAVFGIALELAVPAWAERAGQTPWHAHHIAERYGLMTIIVLGECVLGTANSIASVLQSEGWSWRLAAIGLGGLGLVLALWWTYFLLPSAEALHRHRERAWAWGYGHFFLFASVAALGSGLEVVADMLKTPLPGASPGHGPTALATIVFLAVPLAIYVLALWLQWLWVTRALHRQTGMVLSCLGCFALVVPAVALGLSLPLALPLLCVGPVLLIAYNEHGRKHCGEFFQVR